MSLADDGEMIGVVRTCTKRGVWWEKEEDVRYLPKVRPIVELESNQFSIPISTGTNESATIPEEID